MSYECHLRHLDILFLFGFNNADIPTKLKKCALKSNGFQLLESNQPRVIFMFDKVVVGNHGAHLHHPSLAAETLFVHFGFIVGELLTHTHVSFLSHTVDIHLCYLLELDAVSKGIFILSSNIS